MVSATPLIPIRIAKLIIGFTHNKLFEAGMDELDLWLEESDDNMKAYHELIDDVINNIFSADDLIIETDELLDAWMVAGLIARQMQGMLGQDEKRALDRWREAAPRNEDLYQLFSDKANLQKFVTWLKTVNRDSAAGLN